MVGCRGCKTQITTLKKKECAFTNSGIKFIPECPCMTCLVKVLCEYTCEKLYETAKFLPDIVTFFNGEPRCMVGVNKDRKRERRRPRKLKDHD